MSPESIRYNIEVDEEGFPVFDGLRVEDAELLRIFFGSIRREGEGMASRIFATCEGETCRVLSFDAPLVAQSVSDVGSEESTWNFLGAVSHVVKHQHIEEDEWHRLHAWVGPKRLPAVLSRKAQAAFLQRAPIEGLKPPFFRGNDRAQGAAFWQAAYLEGKDGWEMGRVNPILPVLGPAVLSRVQGPILVPGAGRGHEAAWFADQGRDCVALDLAPQAKTEFQAAYRASRVDYRIEDFFAHARAHPARYGAIYENVFYCALEPRQRRAYWQAMQNLLAPGGRLFGSFFTDANQGGPPFGTTQWELREHSKAQFEVRDWRYPKEVHPKRAYVELWTELVSKGASTETTRPSR
jgi:hypothetical protein